MNIIARDIDNDITLIQTTTSFYVRYGLQQTKFNDLTHALDDFRDCLSHAVSCNHNL